MGDSKRLRFVIVNNQEFAEVGICMGQLGASVSCRGTNKLEGSKGFLAPSFAAGKCPLFHPKIKEVLQSVG